MEASPVATESSESDSSSHSLQENDEVRVDPTSWEATEASWERSLRTQEQLEDRHDYQAPLRVLRVNQLDATKLDEELNDILKGQFMKIFTFFKVSRFCPSSV